MNLRKYIVLALLIIVSPNGFSAIDFETAAPAWDQHSLLIQNVAVDGKHYWGRFSYDFKNDQFTLADAGQELSGQRYRKKFNFLGAACQLSCDWRILISNSNWRKK